MSKKLKIFITDIAKSDISNITNYINIDNKSAATDIIELFYKTFELISDYPETGSIKNYITNKTTRIYTVKKSFSIVYRIKNNRIEILRILTRYQNLTAILK